MRSTPTTTTRSHAPKPARPRLTPSVHPTTPRAPNSLKSGINSRFHRDTRGLVAALLKLLGVVLRCSLLGHASPFGLRCFYSGFKLFGVLGLERSRAGSAMA